MKRVKYCLCIIIYIALIFSVYDTPLSFLSLKTAPGDYTSVSPTALTFGPNQLSQDVNVTVADDVIQEDEERFFGSLSTTDRAVVLQPGRGDVNITDNDSKNV